MQTYLCIACTTWVKDPEVKHYLVRLCRSCYEAHERVLAHLEGEHEDEHDPFCERCLAGS
jgi:hypothetical protein